MTIAIRMQEAVPAKNGTPLRSRIYPAIGIELLEYRASLPYAGLAGGIVDVNALASRTVMFAFDLRLATNGQLAPKVFLPNISCASHDNVRAKLPDVHQLPIREAPLNIFHGLFGHDEVGCDVGEGDLIQMVRSAGNELSCFGCK